MVETIELYLNEKYENGLLYEEDVNEIKKMYKELKMYTYEEIFNSKSVRYKESKSKIVNKKFDIENIHTYTYGVIEPIDNKICKILHIHKDCDNIKERSIDFLIEIYFQNLAKKYINTENVIIPKIYNYGYINGDKYNLYFFEMDYYIETYNNIINKELKELINKVEINNEKTNALLQKSINYKNGVNYLRYIEEKYNIYHNDYTGSLVNINNHKKLIEKIKECKVLNKDFNNRIDNLISNSDLEITNLLSNNLKCIIIDFENCYRVNTE